MTLILENLFKGIIGIIKKFTQNPIPLNILMGYSYYNEI